MLAALALTATLLWPGPEITYRFDRSVGPVERSVFHSAVELWNSDFVPVRAREVPGNPLTDLLWWLGLESSVLVKIDPQLNAFGKTTLGAGPRRQLTFRPDLSAPEWLEADLAHEWGHVLGLTHEHQRFDRDRFVRLSAEFLARLSPERRLDYEKNPDDPPAEQPRPYDYESLMHYSSNIDGNRMVRRDTGALIPGARTPSAGDWARLFRLYAATKKESQRP